MKYYILLFIMICCLFFQVRAQDYYWQKATGFPDQEANLNVTDLQAADGVIQFNKQWYAYDDAITFKPIESLINQDPAQPGNFYWTGPQGKWIIEDKPNTYFPNVYTLDPATKQVKTFCNTFNYMYYGSINKDNIVYFKNQYYTTGKAQVSGSSEVPVFRRYNPSSCTWDVITLPTQPNVSSSLDKLASDGDNMYCFGTDLNLGVTSCHVTQEASTWKEINLPAPILNNPWYFPKRQILSDKRGFIWLTMGEYDQVTKQSLTRYFILTNQQFIPVAMGGDQPTLGYWGNFKRFDSGNFYSITSFKEVLLSKDNGTTWEKFSIVNEPPSINDFIETSNGTFYIGTAEGVYVLKKFKDPRPNGCTDLSFTKKTGDKTICKKGDVTFTMTGGKAPYTFHFGEQHRVTSDSMYFSELENGYHEIEIEDANGCMIQTDFYINHIVKTPLQVDITDKQICNENFSINMVYGYPPYQIKWTEGTVEKTVLYERNTSQMINSYTIAKFVLDQNLTYNFTVSDQSGCPVVYSTQQGTSFKPELTYVSTASCDSVNVNISIKNSTFDQFRLIIKNVNGSTISSQTWTGPDFTAKVLHNEYYSFNIYCVVEGCNKIFVERFRRPKLNSFTVSGEGCSNSPDGKGSVRLYMTDFDPIYHSIVWSDIGVLNTYNRTDINAGNYTFEVKEKQTGCLIKKPFEITKVPVPILPDVPFLCPEDTFNIVPATTDLINPTRFYLWNQDKLVTTIANGDTLTVRNGKDNAYRISSYNSTTRCFSIQVPLDVQGTENVPEISEKFYSFCYIGDEVQLNTTSTYVHWYSGLNNDLLGKGQMLDYTTLQAQDSIYLVLKNDEGSCHSDSTTIYLQQTFIDPPSIAAVQLNATEQVLKPILQSGLLTNYSYAWYGDDTFIKYGDSLVIDLDQWHEIKVVARDLQGCTSEKSIGIIVAIPTSSQEQDNPTFIRLYPNPAADVITFDIDQEFSNGSFALKDMNGRLLQDNTKLEKHNQLALTKLSAGVYFLEITLGDQLKVYKLLKQ